MNKNLYQSLHREAVAKGKVVYSVDISHILHVWNNQ
jgi:hypothetical protein